MNRIIGIAKNPPPLSSPIRQKAARFVRTDSAEVWRTRGEERRSLSSDEKWMKQALQLAEKGRPWTSPNPLVGAVLVKNNRLVAQGYHAVFGAPHAEVAALRKAGNRSRGSTLYVTLEPCSTYGKTPPCTESIKQAGIKRVVIGAIDPNPVHRGRGISILKKNRIRVVTGILEKDALRQNEAYVKWMTKKIPLVILKMAQSLDGKIASRTGNSQWISGPTARAWVHRLRSQVDAVLIGKNTLLRDDPRLTARNPFPLYGGRLGWGLSPHLSAQQNGGSAASYGGIPPPSARKRRDSSGRIPPKFGEQGGRNSSSILAARQELKDVFSRDRSKEKNRTCPWRIVLDPRGECSRSARIFKQKGPIILACSERFTKQIVKKFSEEGITILPLKERHGKLDLKQLLSSLGSLGITSLLVEGGGELAGSLIEEGLVDQVKWIVAPKIVGGRDAKTSVEGMGAKLISHAQKIKSLRVSLLGEDFLFEGCVA